MNVLLLSSDLTVTSMVEGAARQSGLALASFGNSTALRDRAKEILGGAKPAALHPSAPLVIVDLSTTNLDVAALVKSLAELADEPPAVWAFGPHVHENRLEAARRAGCQLVLTRGQFHAQIAQRLAGWKDARAASL